MCALVKVEREFSHVNIQVWGVCFRIKGRGREQRELARTLTTALDPQAEGSRRPLQNKSNGSQRIIRDRPIPRPHKRHGRHAVIHWYTFRLQKTHTKDK